MDFMKNVLKEFLMTLKIFVSLKNLAYTQDIRVEVELILILGEVILFTHLVLFAWEDNKHVFITFIIDRDSKIYFSEENSSIKYKLNTAKK